MHTMDTSAPCRLCDENKEKMLSIFSKNDDGLQILHLIKECLPLIIYRTDPLPKQICSECFDKLDVFYRFKKSCLGTAGEQKGRLRNSEDNVSKRVQLYLACDDTDANEVINSNNIPKPAKLSSKGTSTDDLTISCINCKSTCFDSTIINSEVELCAELHKAIADSLSNNKVITQSDEKVVRSRRRRSQAFYHELDDSLCSSLTEFTNTESSQCYEEYHSDVESYESESEDLERVKRRKLEHPIVVEVKEVQAESQVQEAQAFNEIFKGEVEYRYFPLSLMTLALNVVNKKIVPDHEPDDFYEKTFEPQCTYCREKFKNSKLLAIHEVQHINIELGEKVDNPIPWHESRDDANVRNKWLNSYDEVDEDESTEYMECEVDPPVIAESLLIPVGTEVPQEHKSAGDIILVMAKPVVNGLALSDYSKEERKSFYKSMKIGGVNKKFCALCRYSFKDNWAIESHYFSLACYYTCRYCGMRFNKQRHRFDEHVKEHEDRGDPLSTKIYAASKLNNFVPRIIQPDKVKKMVAQHDHEPLPKMQTIKVRNFSRRSLQPDIKIKEEKMDSDDEKPPPALQKAPQTLTKTTNQAYFCRKCYKVFFKLDEFNIHSKNCDYNQFPQGRNNMNKFSTRYSSNGEMVSSSGRPVRHCVRETGTYKDEAYVPDTMLKETSQNQQSFVCFICNTPFPTIYSRNSHMRIHKGETNNTKPVISQRPRQSFNDSLPSYSSYIKQEPLEPEVQIHESEQNYNSNSSIGSVSITPISKNPNQKATINPNIMKLVQNNPHLTIKANRSPERQPAPSGSNAHNNLSDSDKSYKCSSCWEAFSNKSHLYFHKKNQCEGSKYPCPFCKKRFGTEAAYSSHIFYSHPE